MSVIQLTVSSTCSKYGIPLLCYSITLFSVSFVCSTFRQTIRLLTVSYRPFQTSTHNSTNTNYITCSCFQYCAKTYRSNWPNKMSKQHNSSVRQEYWSFKISIKTPAKETNSQSWPIAKLNCGKLKYSQFTECSNCMTPLSLKTKALTRLDLLIR